MIDLTRARNYFSQYTGQYDPNVARIRLKIEHIEHVAQNSREIARIDAKDPYTREHMDKIGKYAEAYIKKTISR